MALVNFVLNGPQGRDARAWKTVEQGFLPLEEDIVHIFQGSREGQSKVNLIVHIAGRPPIVYLDWHWDQNHIDPQRKLEAEKELKKFLKIEKWKQRGKFNF